MVLFLLVVILIVIILLLLAVIVHQHVIVKVLLLVLLHIIVTVLLFLVLLHVNVKVLFLLLLMTIKFSSRQSGLQSNDHWALQSGGTSGLNWGRHSRKGETGGGRHSAGNDQREGKYLSKPNGRG